MTDAPRLIATDIDGTLLGPDKRVSAGTRDAFRHVHAQTGTGIVLVSSRMPASLRRIEAALGVPCWKIAYDGAVIDGPAGTAIAFPEAAAIDRAEARDLIAANPLDYVGVYCGDDWLCNASSTWSRREEHNTEVAARIASKLPAAFDMRDGPVHKIMFRDETTQIDALRARLAAAPLRTARWFSNGPTILEIVPDGANKARALDWLVKHLGIPRERVTVFGDGANDVAMFDHYPDSVAVANAIPAILARARYRTGRGDEDGVAAFLRSAWCPD